MSEVQRLCDRVAIMNRGKILTEGTLEDLADQNDEDDLEEMFYQLISKSEAEHHANANHEKSQPAAI